MNENETQNIAQDTTNVQNTTNVQDTNQVNPNLGNKKKGNAIWIIPIILILAIIAVAVYYFGYYTSTEQFYKRLIGVGVEKLAISNEEDYKTAKANVKLDMDFKAEAEEISSEVEDVINDLELEIETQIDKENEQLVVNFGSEYDNEDLLNLDVYADAKDKVTYIYAKDFLDKYLEVELEDEYYTELAEIFVTEETNPIAERKTAKIFKTELSKIVKSKYCSTDKETIKINGEEVKTTKRTIEMTYQQFVDEFIEAMNNIKDYEDIEDSREFAKLVEDAKDELQETIEGYEDAKIQINIYTTGLFQKVAKVEVVVIDEEEVTLAFTQIDDKKYSIEMLSDEEVLINTILDMSNKGKIKLDIEIEEVGKLTLNIDYSEEYDMAIDTVNKNKCAKIEELSQDEQMTLMQNLQKSPIYTLLQQFAIIDSEQSDVIIEDDENTTNTDNTNTTNSTLKDNQILTYDNETLVTFGIPAGYTSDRISNNYQTLENDDTDITIRSDYSDEAEFYNSLKSSLSYYSQQSYYKDVTLSEKMTMTVGNNTFYYATKKMTYVSGSYEDTYTTLYIWKSVSNDYVLEIEIEEPSEMSQEDLNQLLTIETSNV